MRLFAICYQARRKQLESGAAKTKEILKTPQQKGFYFLFQKNLVLTGKKHCGESRRYRNASAGPDVYQVHSCRRLVTSQQKYNFFCLPFIFALLFYLYSCAVKNPGITGFCVSKIRVVPKQTINE